MNSYVSERIKDICNLYTIDNIDLNTLRLRLATVFITFPEKDIKLFIREMSTKNGEG